MLAVVRAVALRLDDAGVHWLLAGGAARMLRGAPVRPRDVDVEVREQDAARAARALGLPPPALAEGGGWRSLRSEGLLAGVPIDLSGGITVSGPGGTLSGPDPGPVTSGGHSYPRDGPPGLTVPLLPDGEALARAVVCGDEGRRARAAAALPAAAPP
ncbi:MAG: hypothetical protein ACO3PB_09425, partial [Miltoncostaeaceae bacterium]